MPYKKSQVAEYGPSFVPWEEEQFSQMLGSLTGGLPLNSIACMPFFRLIDYLSL